jgi:hypothetical protein
LYFAYSTVLDREAFETWRTEHSYGFFQLPEGRVATAKGIDLVFDFPSRWWGGRVAGLVDKPGSEICGLVFEIQAVDWPIVQHKEGFVTGMCIERKVQVTVDGKVIEATAFTTAPNRANQSGEISQDFISALIRGAQQAKLPSEYMSKLASLKAE